MARLTPYPKMQFFGSTGQLLSGGKLYTYEAGTTTPKATYTDEGGLTANTNPIILDSLGMASVWLGVGKYKFVLYNSLEELQPGGGDNIDIQDFALEFPPAFEAGIKALVLDTVDELTQLLGDNSFVGTCIVKDLVRGGTFVYDATKVLEDNQGTNFNGWIRQYSGDISVKWFGAVGDGVADDTIAIQAALNTGHSIYVPYGTFLYISSIGYTSDNQAIRGSGNNSVLISGDGSVYINTSGHSNCSISYIKINGDGTNGGIRITDGSENTTIDNIYFLGGSQRVWIYTADYIRITNCIFDGTGYGVIQQYGFSSSYVTIDGNIALNMINDFVEANCGNVSSYSWTITNNTYNNSVNYPTPTTEARFVGITGVSGVIISNNQVYKSGGDSAIHLEDIEGETIISGNQFDNCLVGSGNTGYIYLLNSAENVVVSGNIFRRTDNTLGYASAISANSNSYVNSTIFSNNRIYGSGPTGNFGGMEWGFQLGDSLISGNQFEDLVYAMNIVNTNNVSFVNNRVLNNGSGIFLTRTATSGGGQDWLVSGNVFTGMINYDIFSLMNTNGTNAPSRWMIKGNKFSKLVRLGGQPSSVPYSTGDAYLIQFTDNYFSSGATATFTGTMTQLSSSGNKYYDTPSSGAEITGSQLYNIASLINGGKETFTIVVTGAAITDSVTNIFSSVDTLGVDYRAWVSATNTVSVTFTNNTGSTKDIAEGTFSVRVLKL